MLRRCCWMAVATTLSCGGGGSTDDPCPTGDCTLPGSTIVKFMFDHYPEWLFPNDTCIDMGAARVQVDVSLPGDPASLVREEAECGNGQVTFVGLPQGTYDVALVPVDAAGAPIVKAALPGTVTAGTPGAPSETTIFVPWDAWTGTYTGTFLFRLSWAGMSCGAAQVATQTLKLVAGGHVVAKVTDKDQRVDGTDPQACRELSEPFAQFVRELPFGPATLEVTGKDGAGDTRYHHEFATFIGADMNNPTIVFDVEAVAGTPPGDAGVADAPTD
jgi:hypothetical protein